jgi:hypothetical protein
LPLSNDRGARNHKYDDTKPSQEPNTEPTGTTRTQTASAASAASSELQTKTTDRQILLHVAVLAGGHLNAHAEQVRQFWIALETWDNFFEASRAMRIRRMQTRSAELASRVQAFTHHRKERLHREHCAAVKGRRWR